MTVSDIGSGTGFSLFCKKSVHIKISFRIYWISRVQGRSWSVQFIRSRQRSEISVLFLVGFPHHCFFKVSKLSQDIAKANNIKRCECEYF